MVHAHGFVDMVVVEMEALDTVEVKASLVGTSVKVDWDVVAAEARLLSLSSCLASNGNLRSMSFAIVGAVRL